MASLKYSVSEEKHNRSYMEDRNEIREFIIENYKYTIYAVYDGHGGSWVSEQLKMDFSNYLIQKLKEFPQENIDKYLSSIVISFDKILYEKTCKLTKKEQSGSTAIIALRKLKLNSFISTDNSEASLKYKDILYLINLGDSKAAVFKNGDNIFTTKEHSFDEKETKRISDAGGIIINGRLFGSINLSRSFGDFDYKFHSNKKEYSDPKSMILSPIPTISKLSSDSLSGCTLVLASDGMWDVISLEELTRKLTITKDASSIMEYTIQQDKNKGVGDNITIIVASL